jgi:L-alanine-DL-glutamate epimerase-like enolase superfamily enzyme
LGQPAPKTYDDLARIGEDVRRQGFRALKTTILLPDGDGFRNYRPTTGETAGFPELNLTHEVVEGTRRELEALQRGAGPGVRVMLDVNFFFKPEGFLRLARALEPLELGWLEMDSYDPGALASVRRGTRVPIASCEHLYGRRGYRPFLDAGAIDVAIVDPIWNGFAEAMKIAALVDAYEMNVAPHNYYGYLSDFIAANFAAAIPNLRVMEIDMDAVPWRHEFYTHAPEIAGGEMRVPMRPGWGTDINEAGVRAHPPKAK